MVSEDDMEYFIRVWAANDCNWARAVMFQDKGQAWLNLDQIAKVKQSMDIAVKLKNVCIKDRSRWRFAEDLPGDYGAMEFLVNVKDS